MTFKTREYDNKIAGTQSILMMRAQKRCKQTGYGLKLF